MTAQSDKLGYLVTEKLVKRFDEAVARERAIQDARAHFMPFVRFTSPDPAEPDDATRSAYDNQYFHDAIAARGERLADDHS